MPSPVATKTSVLVVAALLALSGCAQDAGPRFTSDGDLVAHESLFDEASQPWERAEEVSDKEIRITFDSLVCFGYRAEAVESDDVVKVHLYRGRVTQQVAPCTLADYTSTMVVKTDGPIGDREVVDGYQTPRE